MAPMRINDSEFWKNGLRPLHLYFLPHNNRCLTESIRITPANTTAVAAIPYIVLPPNIIFVIFFLVAVCIILYLSLRNESAVYTNH